MDKGHYAFVQIHRMHNTKNEPYGTLWIWVHCDVSM